MQIAGMSGSKFFELSLLTHFGHSTSLIGNPKPDGRDTQQSPPGDGQRCKLTLKVCTNEKLVMLQVIQMIATLSGLLGDIRPSGTSCQ